MAADFHTHNTKTEINALISAKNLICGKHVSYQIHPWDLPEKFDPDILPSHNFLLPFEAIGEVGLDKLHAPELNLQTCYLNSLFSLAADMKKPVVIHCVKAFAELFAAMKPYKYLRIMFHGFRSSPEMLDELWKRNITVSFHHSVINSPAIMQKIKNASGAFGFESDDDLQISVPGLLYFAEEKYAISNLEKITDQHFSDFLEI